MNKKNYFFFKKVLEKLELNSQFRVFRRKMSTKKKSSKKSTSRYNPDIVGSATNIIRQGGLQRLETIPIHKYRKLLRVSFDLLKFAASTLNSFKENKSGDKYISKSRGKFLHNRLLTSVFSHDGLCYNLGKAFFVRFYKKSDKKSLAFDFQKNFLIENIKKTRKVSVKNNGARLVELRKNVISILSKENPRLNQKELNIKLKNMPSLERKKYFAEANRKNNITSVTKKVETDEELVARIKARVNVEMARKKKEQEELAEAENYLRNVMEKVDRDMRERGTSTKR